MDRRGKTLDGPRERTGDRLFPTVKAVFKFGIHNIESETEGGLVEERWTTMRPESYKPIN